MRTWYRRYEDDVLLLLLFHRILWLRRREQPVGGRTYYHYFFLFLAFLPANPVWYTTLFTYCFYARTTSIEWNGQGKFVLVLARSSASPSLFASCRHIFIIITCFCHRHRQYHDNHHFAIVVFGFVWKSHIGSFGARCFLFGITKDGLRKYQRQR
jgi:hypothetical protein